MDKNVYIRLRHRIQVKENQKVFLKDIALIHAPEPILAKVERTMIHQVSKKDKNIVIIDGMTIIRAIKEQLPETDIHLIGSQQTIIEVVYKKVKMSTALFLLVWCLLFIGSAFSIMNFHEDVSMQEVHQKLFYLMTGINDPKPLTLQIPYSIGLGLGMILFFNHVFKKRINEEPSPLEVEMFNYQQALDQYVIMNENEASVKSIDDDNN